MLGGCYGQFHRRRREEEGKALSREKTLAGGISDNNRNNNEGMQEIHPEREREERERGRERETVTLREKDGETFLRACFLEGRIGRARALDFWTREMTSFCSLKTRRRPRTKRARVLSSVALREASNTHEMVDNNISSNRLAINGGNGSSVRYLIQTTVPYSRRIEYARPSVCKNGDGEDDVDRISLPQRQGREKSLHYVPRKGILPPFVTYWWR